MLSENLKKHTSAVHTDLEQRLLARIKGVRDVHHYGSLLALMYGYYAALEKELDNFSAALPDYYDRRKSDAILQDLVKLNYPTESLYVCDDLPAIDSVPSALGVMYVLEGSTLGGKVISRMLKKQLPSVADSTSFFEGYGERTGEMWEKFRQHLSDSVEEASYSKTENAAHETFLKFNNWIQQNEPA